VFTAEPADVAHRGNIDIIACFNPLPLPVLALLNGVVFGG